MKTRPYKYDIPPAIFVSPRTHANDYIATQGIITTSDKHGSQKAIVNLYNDFIRGVKFFGLNSIDHPLESEAMLSRELAERVPLEALDKLCEHYSQGPLLFMSAPIASIVPRLVADDHVFVIKEPLGEDREFNYLLKDNEIIFEGVVNRHPIYNLMDSKLVGYVNGRTQGQFLLTNSGFILTTFKTNSNFIHDVYINPQLINPDRLAIEIERSQRNLKSEDKILRYLDKELKSYFIHLSESFKRKFPKEDLSGLGASITETNLTALRATMGENFPKALTIIGKIEILVKLKTILINEAMLPNYKVIELYNKTLDENKRTLSLHQSEPNLFRPSKSHGEKFVDSSENYQKKKRSFI